MVVERHRKGEQNVDQRSHDHRGENADHDADLIFDGFHRQGPAENLPTNVVTKIRTLAKRICHTLELDGYCRIDFRLSKDNVPYFIEANPNPEIAESQEFAQAALHAGVSYADLLNRIVALGLKRAGVEL